MKKIVCLCLTLLLLVQCLGIGAFATETQDPTTVTDQTTETAEPPTVEFGTASTTNGCRTIEGAMPLAGSARMLDTAQAAFAFEKNTGTVIYSYNPDTPLYPGSLAQLVTALVVLDNCTMSEMVTVSSSNISRLPAGSSNVYLKEGERISVENLLYCMILYSANDAAIALAEHVAGSLNDFVDLMNQKVQELGCTSTKLSNVHGLDDANQYTTARDMAKIMAEAMDDPRLSKILFTGGTYKVGETNKSKERVVYSLNYLLANNIVSKFYYDRVTGGKVSYTSATAGASIACTAENDDMSLICVVMGAKREFSEATGNASVYGNFEEVIELLDFCFDGYRVCRLLYDGQTMEQFSVANGCNDVVGVNKSEVDAVLPKDARMDTLILRYAVENGGLIAPVQFDQQIATLQLWYQNSCVAETRLYALSAVSAVEKSGVKIQSGATRDDSNLKEILSFLGVACLVILVPLAAYLIYNSARRAYMRKLRRRRRKQHRQTGGYDQRGRSPRR